jgi:hypothetical protein
MPHQYLRWVGPVKESIARNPEELAILLESDRLRAAVTINFIMII